MNFGNAAAVVHRAVALTAEYFEVYRHGSKVPRRNDYMYIRTCIPGSSSSGPHVGAIDCGAGCPL